GIRIGPCPSVMLATASLGRRGDMHVLIVDDDPIVRVALSEMLGDEGHETSTAPTGRAALELLNGGLRPGVVLLDLMMPDMDGWELIDQIKKDPTLNGIPLAVISANADPPTRITSKMPGLAVIAKPFERQVILETLRKLSGVPVA